MTLVEISFDFFFLGIRNRNQGLYNDFELTGAKFRTAQINLLFKSSVMIASLVTVDLFSERQIFKAARCNCTHPHASPRKPLGCNSCFATRGFPLQFEKAVVDKHNSKGFFFKQGRCKVLKTMGAR